jgi:hypothetical protein
MYICHISDSKRRFSTDATKTLVENMNYYLKQSEPGDTRYWNKDYIYQHMAVMAHLKLNEKELKVNIPLKYYDEPLSQIPFARDEIVVMSRLR